MILNQAQLELLSSILHQTTMPNECDGELLDTIIHDVDFELNRITKRNEVKKKGALTKEQKDEIYTLLIDCIVNRKPAYLYQIQKEDSRCSRWFGGSHNGEWFNVDEKKKQVQWNWRNSNTPVALLADYLGYWDEWFNSNVGDTYGIIQRVLRSKVVKDIKNNLKTW